MDMGIMIIFNDRFHLSGLFNRYLLIEYGRKGIGVKKNLDEGIEVRLNFLVAQR